jgi:hypothetical protein
MIRRASPSCDSVRFLVLAACVAITPGLASPADQFARGVATSPPRYPVLGAETGAFDFSGLLSLDIPTSDLDVGPRVTGELMYGAYDIAPQLRLLVGARAAFAYHSHTAGSLWLLEAVPDVKLRGALTEKLGVYGDIGLGLAFLHTSVDIPGGSATDNSVPLTIQFGIGASLALTPDLSLVSEFRVDTYTKSGSSVFIAFPTLGLMWRMM